MSLKFKPIVIAAFILLSDQASKLIARAVGVAQLNQAGVFGLGADLPWTLIHTLLLLGLTLWLYRRKQDIDQPLIWLTILVSGISNGIDRWLYQGVWDWIYYPVVNLSGNLADVYLFLAVSYYLYLHIFKQANLESSTDED